MEKETRTVTRSLLTELKENGEVRLARVLTYDNGHRIEIPINRDGSVKWFDDVKLLKEHKL